MYDHNFYFLMVFLLENVTKKLTKLQRRIQNPVKHLRCSVLRNSQQQKALKNLRKNAPSYILARF